MESGPVETGICLKSPSCNVAKKKETFSLGNYFYLFKKERLKMLLSGDIL